MDAQSAISAIVIKHPAYRRAFDSLRGFVDNAFTARGEARCALLSGPARCGKTTLAEMLEAEVRARPKRVGVQDDGQPKRRTLFVGTPAQATQKSLAETILLAAGDPVGGRGTQAQMTIRVAKLLRDLHVELLVLDEFHHLVTSNTKRIAFETAEWVKTLLNVGVCPILLVGIERAEVVLDTNRQLQGRCWARPTLAPFGWSTAEEQAAFRKLLSSFGGLLRPRDASARYSRSRRGYAPRHRRCHWRGSDSARESQRSRCKAWAAQGSTGPIRRRLRRLVREKIERARDKQPLPDGMTMFSLMRHERRSENDGGLVTHLQRVKDQAPSLIFRVEAIAGNFAVHGLRRRGPELPSDAATGIGADQLRAVRSQVPSLRPDLAPELARLIGVAPEVVVSRLYGSRLRPESGLDEGETSSAFRFLRTGFRP